MKSQNRWRFGGEGGDDGVDEVSEEALGISELVGWWRGLLCELFGVSRELCTLLDVNLRITFRITFGYLSS